jgi:V-type H+-transporting ATPase subunit G
MSQKKDGIQQLLTAEKKATDQINEARKRKVQKLKTAKKEADAEILKVKTEREAKFKNFEQEQLGKKSNSESQIQVQTNQKLKEQEAMMKNNRGRTMKSIQEVLFSIDVEPHVNVKF